MEEGGTVSRSSDEGAEVEAPFGVASPVQCLHLGDSVAWFVGEGVYPVYDSESLTNSVFDFDASPYRSLASELASQQVANNNGKPTTQAGPLRKKAKLWPSPLCEGLA